MKGFKKIRKQDAFKVPENYFENLEAKLIDEHKQKVSEQRFPWLEQFIYHLQLRFTLPSLMVASLALIVIYISLERENQMISMSDQDIQNYLIENFDDQLEADIYAMSMEDEVPLDPIMSDQDILEYLEEESIELELIDEYLN